MGGTLKPTPPLPPPAPPAARLASQDGTLVDFRGETAAPKLHRLWLINKLAVNHAPINVNNRFVHRMEDVPGPASLVGLVMKSACGDQAKGNQVECLARWPNALVFHCPRNELGAKGGVERQELAPKIPAAPGRTAPLPP